MTTSVCCELLDDPRDVARVVLAVGVDLHDDVVALLDRVPEARAHGAADAEVEREVEHRDAVRAGDRARRGRRSRR